MKNTNKKIVFPPMLLLLCFLLFEFKPVTVHASYNYPQSATAEYRYSQYEDISIVFLNKAKANALANQFASRGRVSSQTWSYALGLIPYFGQVYGFSEFCSGAMSTITANTIRQKLKSNAGIRIETWRPARGMGGGVVSIVYGWNGKRSGITLPYAAQPKYLGKYKGFYITN